MGWCHSSFYLTSLPNILTTWLLPVQNTLHGQSPSVVLVSLLSNGACPWVPQGEKGPLHWLFNGWRMKGRDQGPKKSLLVFVCMAVCSPDPEGRQGQWLVSWSNTYESESEQQRSCMWRKEGSGCNAKFGGWVFCRSWMRRGQYRGAKQLLGILGNWTVKAQQCGYRLQLCDSWERMFQRRQGRGRENEVETMTSLIFFYFATYYHHL